LSGPRFAWKVKNPCNCTIINLVCINHYETRSIIVRFHMSL